MTHSKSLQFIKICRKHHKLSNRRNLLNQVMENFYDVLRKIDMDQYNESAKFWMLEYEQYRKK
ncbi:5829_t:CDS:1, partial [Scutellospora calospora]